MKLIVLGSRGDGDEHVIAQGLLDLSVQAKLDDASVAGIPRSVQAGSP